ncbi:unnamed protein product, partial [Prorocentrum cordatum]
DQLARSLGTHLENGMATSAVVKRLEEFGLNKLKSTPKPTLLMLFIVQLTNLIITLLIIAACASLVVNGTSDKNDDPLSYIEGIAIFIIVILNAGIAAFTENSANDALEKLSKMTAPEANIVRDGKMSPIKSDQIVPGLGCALATGADRI